MEVADPDEFSSLVHGLAQRSHRLYRPPAPAAAAEAAAGSPRDTAAGRLAGADPESAAVAAGAAGRRLPPEVAEAVRR